jgi:hypothetical protein
MEQRREMFEVAIRLAVLVSAVAALAAVVLTVVGDVSTTRLVTTVAVIGFVTSWKVTARFTPAPAELPSS